MESLERFVMLATSNDITRVQLDHGHVSHHSRCQLVLAFGSELQHVHNVAALQKYQQ